MISILVNIYKKYFFLKKKVRIKADKYHCKLNVAIASTILVHLVHVLEKKLR